MSNVYNWAVSAEPGEVMVYHDGPRARESNSAGVAAEGAIFGKAWQAHTAGLVFLAQRRVRKGLNKGALQYVAIRVSAYAARKLGIIPPVQESLSYRRAV